MKSFKFDELAKCPLVIDALYEGGAVKGLRSEVISKIFSANSPDGKKSLKVHNTGGFRYRGSRPNPHVVVLTSTSSEPAWPDAIDPMKGQLRYFGDNKRPGELHETPLGGNQILADSFSRYVKSMEDRLSLSVFFYFTKWKGYTQQFRGLVVPGGINVDEPLSAVWSTKDNASFQNYCATFTVLDIPSIPRIWIEGLMLNQNKLEHAPEAFKKWVNTGEYEPLLAENVAKPSTG